MRLRTLLLATFSLLPLSLPAAETLDSLIAAHARKPLYAEASLSPTGEYLAAIATVDEQQSLVMLRLKDLKLVSALKLRGQEGAEHVLDYWWSGPGEVVATLGRRFGDRDTVFSTGEMMAMRANDSYVRYVAGYRGRASSSSQDSFTEMLDPTPTIPDSAVVVLYPANDDRDAPKTVYRLNTLNGDLDFMAKGPKADARFVTDSKGALRYAIVPPKAGDDDAEDSAGTEIYRYAPAADAKNPWQKLAKPEEGQLTPTFVSNDDRWLHYRARGLKGSESDADCLARQPLDGSGPVEQISCLKGHSLVHTITSADGNEALAALYDPGVPQLDVINGAHPGTALLVELQKAFPGRFAKPVSHSHDGKLSLILASSSGNPGGYHLYDHKANSLRPLFDAKPWLPQSAGLATQPFEYEAREGSTIHGYLTLPRAGSYSGAKPPLVVMPHGGPFTIRENWGYEPDSQLLASQGYAVFRPNIRGSGGYGLKFVRKGKRQWGKDMIDDLTDGTRALIAKGLVDGNRIAIVGASYGGYAAMMSAVREPLLYKAVVSFLGVSDLNLLVTRKYDMLKKESRDYVENYIGATETERAQQSPINLLARLKAPVLLAHGKSDGRVPFEQATNLHSALKARNHPVETFFVPDEGHGFNAQKNREEYYRRVLDFLGRQIKP